MTNISLTEIETALDAGTLFWLTSTGTYWRCRRNGRTKTWKTRPGQFEIPIKAGFRSTSRITHRSQFNEGIGSMFLTEEHLPTRNAT